MSFELKFQHNLAALFGKSEQIRENSSIQRQIYIIFCQNQSSFYINQLMPENPDKVTNGLI